MQNSAQWPARKSAELGNFLCVKLRRRAANRAVQCAPARRWQADTLRVKSQAGAYSGFFFGGRSV